MGTFCKKKYNIGLARKLVWVLYKVLWKNLNKILANPSEGLFPPSHGQFHLTKPISFLKTVLFQNKDSRSGSSFVFLFIPSTLRWMVML